MVSTAVRTRIVQPTHKPGPSAPRLWPGSTIVCIGTGPSLTPEDVAHCYGRARVIAVNDAYAICPFADALYAADASWWRHHKGAPHFKGLKFSITPGSGRRDGVTVLSKTPGDGLDVDPHGLKTGRNSGYQAINLAVHLGAARILLLGYDMQVGPNGEKHFFGEHPDRSTSPYASFLALFPSLIAPLKQLNIEIVNCTRRTALTCFPQSTIQQALP